MTKKTIRVGNQTIRILEADTEDYFCISDIAKSGKGRPASFIQNYLRNKNTIEFLGLWEQMNNEHFKVLEFEYFKNQTGMNNFSLSVTEWVHETQAKGLIVEKGKYGGTYAHKDITIHFTTWFSVPFYLYLIKEFQYLSKKNLQWHLEKITHNIEEARNFIGYDTFAKTSFESLKRKGLIYMFSSNHLLAFKKASTQGDMSSPFLSLG